MKLLLYIVLFVMFMNYYTEFKRCLNHTPDISYCATFPSGNAHSSDGHTHQ